jgi:HSP20 family protein
MALLPIRRGATNLTPRRTDPTDRAGIVRVDPWNDFDVMYRMFDSFFRAPFTALGRTMPRMMEAAESQVELYETPDELIAYVYAPGFAPDAFDISITGDALAIKAERKALYEPADGTTSHTPWSTLATSAGLFSASYSLPVEVDAGRCQASYKDGVLTIRMPKNEAAKPKQIKLQVQNG